MQEQTSIRKTHSGNGYVAAVETPERSRGIEPSIRTERVETLIIGGGQSGLSLGYQLSRRGRPYVIVDANERVGDSWRKRWDSLRLFTPAKFNGLAGMPFPADGDYFPTKDEMADFLDAYARRFDLSVRTGVTIKRLWKENDRFVALAAGRRFEAENVVVAMANYQQPRRPEYADRLDPSIVSMHSADYRSPAQVQEGGVLIVGGGNSGSEIAMELARNGHRVWMSGRDVGYIPFRIEGLASRLALGRFVIRFLFHRVLTVDTPIGRKARPKILTIGGPLVRVKPVDLKRAGIERVPRVAGISDGRPVLENGRELDVANVIWCTGFHPGFSWIDLPIFEANGHPRHASGIAQDQPGLYFLGLLFLHSLSSSMVHGVARDSERIAADIDRRMQERLAAA